MGHKDGNDNAALCRITQKFRKKKRSKCCIMAEKREPAERVERENISLGLPRRAGTQPRHSRPSYILAQRINSAKAAISAAHAVSSLTIKTVHSKGERSFSFFAIRSPPNRRGFPLLGSPGSTARALPRAIILCGFQNP